MKSLILALALFFGQWQPDPQYPLRVEIVAANNHSEPMSHGSGYGNINILGQGSRYSGFTYRYEGCADLIYVASSIRARWGGDRPKRLILLSSRGECTLDIATKPYVYSLDQNGKLVGEVWRHQ